MSDAGVSWSLATIRDGAGQDVQGPGDLLRSPMAMRLLPWCGTRCGACLWRRCASMAITNRRTG